MILDGESRAEAIAFELRNEGIRADVIVALSGRQAMRRRSTTMRER
jgi:hypothetical protein